MLEVVGVQLLVGQGRVGQRILGEGNNLKLIAQSGHIVLNQLQHLLMRGGRSADNNRILLGLLIARTNNQNSANNDSADEHQGNDEQDNLLLLHGGCLLYSIGGNMQSGEGFMANGT